MSKWYIYQKEASEPSDEILAEDRLPAPPTWRDFKARRLRANGKNENNYLH